MTDMFGSPVNMGDKIVFGKNRRGSGYNNSMVRSELMTGTVYSVEKKFGQEVAVVRLGNEKNHKDYYLTSRFMLKYEWKKEIK